MFDIGFWEIGIIAIVALLFVGPERLPGLIRTAGKWVGRGQRLAREVRSELEREAVAMDIKDVSREFLAEDKRLKGLVKGLDKIPATDSTPQKSEDKV